VSLRLQAAHHRTVLDEGPRDFQFDVEARERQGFRAVANFYQVEPDREFGELGV
jgi:hypothetical protein